MLLCSLSNTPTLNPVLSLKSHCIFDSKSLETFIKTNGKDPISNEPMELSDIITISNNSNTTLTPNSNEIVSNNYSSIPTMLSAFQSAWDSLSLELFQLRSDLDKTRKELSLSLYRQDAAIKVAVDACKERDEARQALAKLVDNNIISTSNNNHSNNKIDEKNSQQEDNNIPNFSEFTDLIRTEQESLLLKHKKENKERKGKSPIYKLSDVSNLSLSSDKNESLNLKKSGKIINFKSNIENTESIITFESGLFELIDISKDSKKLKVISKLNVKIESNESIPLLSFWNENKPFILSHISQRGRKSKNDKVIPYQLTNLKSKETVILNTELSNISIVASHPSLPILIVSNGKEFEVIYDNSIIYTQEVNGELNDIKFHPDGLLITLSYKSDIGIDIYDLIDRTIKLNIPFENPKDVNFASNGYYLFITGNEGILKLFDLRKNEFIQESIFDKSKNKNSLFLIDIFTSIVIYNGKYSIFDSKGKAWSEKINDFQSLEQNSNIVGISNDGNDVILYISIENEFDGIDLYKIALR